MDMETSGTNLTDSNAVRANTAPAVNQKLEQELRERITAYANKSPQELTERIRELEQAWDVDRALEAGAACAAVTGFVFSKLFGRKWLLLPAFALPALFAHAYQGWCPPATLLRRYGIRTRRELDAEIYALRLLRGDFEGSDKTERALKAVEPELMPVEG
jgi:hypothetical protein